MGRTVIPAWMQPMYEAYHFAPAIIDGEYLRCSGMIGFRPDLTVPEDPTEQFTPGADGGREIRITARLR